MNILFIKDKLRDALLAVSRASGENPTLPILKNVLLRAEPDGVTLTGTNLEIAITAKTQGKVLSPGSVCIPSATLLGVVNNLPSERLSVESKGTTLTIKTDNYSAKIQGSPAEDFPIIPRISGKKDGLEISTGLLKDALEQVMVASQFSELRPELNSIAVAFSLDALTLVATDSFRLAERTILAQEFTFAESKDFTLLLPLKSAQELARILPDGETLKIYHDENQVLFSTDGIELISRLVNGAFPDYKKVVPAKFQSEAVVPREEFLNALTLASVLSTKTNEVKVGTSGEERALKIFSADEAVGENTYLLPAKIKGGAGEVGFNWRYLRDGLRAIQSEEIFFGLNEENKPAMLRSTKDNSYFYIVMPILKS